VFPAPATSKVNDLETVRVIQRMVFLSFALEKIGMTSHWSRELSQPVKLKDRRILNTSIGWRELMPA
jgi:hypothetical protein